MIQEIKCSIGIHSSWSPPWMAPRDVTCRHCNKLLITTEETDDLVKQYEKEMAELTQIPEINPRRSRNFRLPH